MDVNKYNSEPIRYSACNQTFFGQDCFDEHRQNRASKDAVDSVCKYNKYCDMHEHQCYMMPNECRGGNCTGCNPRYLVILLTQTERYMFYYFETQQGTEPCCHSWFWGNKWALNDIDTFCKFVFTEDHKGYTLIALNAKSFDAMFVWRCCIDSILECKIKGFSLNCDNSTRDNSMSSGIIRIKRS